MAALPPELYEREETCPVCGRSFPAVRVRLSRLEVLQRDSDFCVRYREINPYLYSVLVCPHCGYAALENQFQELTPGERRTLAELLRGRRPALDFGGERQPETALAAYKLAIYQAERRGARPTVLAGLCLRAAWLLRCLGDPRERDFLAAALARYLEAHDREPLPAGRMDQHTVEYLIGELHLRLGQPREAAAWFNRVAAARDTADRSLVAMAREGWQRARDAMQAGAAG